MVVRTRAMAHNKTMATEYKAKFTTASVRVATKRNIKPNLNVREDTNHGSTTKQWQQSMKQNLQPPRFVSSRNET